jgi:hypothetical protein
MILSSLFRPYDFVVFLDPMILSSLFRPYDFV